jgi:hypothetical protein
MADPPVRSSSSNRYSELEHEDDSGDDESGEKKGEKGAGMEVDDEIVVVAVSTGDSGDVDGNLTEEDVQDHLDGKVTLRDKSIGQEFVISQGKKRSVNKYGTVSTNPVDLTGGTGETVAAGRTKRTSYSKAEIAKDKSKKSMATTLEGAREGNRRVAVSNEERVEKPATVGETTAPTDQTTRQANERNKTGGVIGLL